MELDPEPTSPIIESRAAELIAPRKRLLGGFSGILLRFSPSERLLLYILTMTLALSAFVLLAYVNTAVSSEVPTQGGALIEGAVGTPRFINPLLAVSQVDHDLTTLVFSGLLRAGSNGEYIPDLAESYNISEDGTTYTFHLRNNLEFHDGTPLTSADVLFTVELAQNSEIKSTRRVDWEGVAASAPDEHTVVFTLPHAYAPFRENATLGILPKHVWENVAPEEFAFSSINTHPVGSGPYRVADMVTDSIGTPTDYVLRSFSGFALGAPYLRTIQYRAFPTEEELIAAYENGDIESFVAASPKTLPHETQESEDLERLTLARVFAVFLNQNHAPILAHAEVRAALESAVDPDAIVQTVLGGYGVPLTGPTPPGFFAHTASTTSAIGTEEARAILSRNGWKFSAASTTPDQGSWTKGTETLTLTLATADTEDLVATAEAVAHAWQAAGIPTKVDVYPLAEFNSSILRPRSYDAVLFGEVVGRSLDLFAFWHSSQRNDPGLNLALYTSTVADKALASARAETDLTKREVFLREFLDVVAEDTPAVFLYSPTIAYIIPERLQGVPHETLTVPSDRFVSVHTWYRDTERIWNVFSN